MSHRTWSLWRKHSRTKTVGGFRNVRRKSTEVWDWCKSVVGQSLNKHSLNSGKNSKLCDLWLINPSENSIRNTLVVYERRRAAIWFKLEPGPTWGFAVACPIIRFHNKQNSTSRLQIHHSFCCCSFPCWATTIFHAYWGSMSSLLVGFEVGWL